jgi:hypothetical protein
MINTKYCSKHCKHQHKPKKKDEPTNIKKVEKRKFGFATDTTPKVIYYISNMPPYRNVHADRLEQKRVAQRLNG